MEPTLDPAEPAETAGAPAAAAAAAAEGAAADGALAAQVSAWHNRHPLAVRVRPDQVLGSGVVALPVLAPDSTRRRAAAAFSEHLMAPVTPRQAAAFAVRHGATERPDITPLREVPAVGANGAAVQWMYLRTVAIEAAGQRVRVLVAAGSEGRRRPAVLGPRLWSLQRTLVAAAMGGAASAAIVAGVLVAMWLPHAAPESPLLADAEPAASGAAADAPPSSASATSAAAVSSAASGVLVASAASAPQVDAPASAPVVAAAASAPAVEPPASAPAVASPAVPPPTAAVAGAAVPAAAASAAAAPASAATVTLAHADKSGDDAAAPADIRPRLTDAQRAEARRVGRQLRGESEPAAATAAASSAASAPPATEGRHFALVTRITRGRAASQVMQSLMASAAAGTPLPGQPRTEVMQVKEGFRAIWWPFASPADAEVARAALTAYGINAEVVEF
jgi:hypothetical protein